MANENDFEMVPVTSGNLASVGFNAETRQIRVSFNRGSVYEYDDCDQTEFDEIVNAPSANDAFNGLLKGIKPYRKVM